MKKYSVLVVSILVVLLVLPISGSLVSAGDSGPVGDENSPAAVDEDVRNYFPIQGRLTDASENPLNGNFTITFYLYDVASGGSPLCSDTNLVQVVNGLFNSEVYGNCTGHITGQQLYLGIQIQGDVELAPRQPIFAVPYAWSLRPGSVIIGTVGPDAILHIENWVPNGRGLRAYAMSATGENYGIVGASKSPDGFGGYIYNNGGGTGLVAASNTGTALRIQGTGIIESTAFSDLWISGNGVRPFAHTDSTYIDMDSVGGAKVFGGAGGVTRNVILPITIAGPLYGQNVTVTGMDLYFSADTGNDKITAVLLRRQTGVCATSSCYLPILTDHTAYACDEAAHPTGCVHHWNFTANNVITDSSGVLYLTIEMTFNGASTWVDIGGVKLPLKHE
jgi:hypothetical protein